MTSIRWVRRTSALAVTLSVTACGGGGRNSSPPPAPSPPSSYTIGGTVTGLSGSGLVLQNNGGNNLAINANGAFTFTTPVTQGDRYNVTVLTQPGTPEQTCVVSSGNGTTGTANVTTVAVACTTNTFAVGVNVSGLIGGGLRIANGSDRIVVSANGSFTFNTRVASGARYNVLIDALPAEPPQRCTVLDGNGVITNAAVTASISCTGTSPTFAYSLNQGDGTLSSFAIDAATGQLRPRFVAKTGAGPAQLVTYKPANGNQFSYVSNQDSNSVSAFKLDPRNGALAEVDGSPFATGGDRPTILTLHPTLPFVYAINENGASIAAYSIDAQTGALTQIGPVATGSSPRAFAIEPAGRFAFVAASGSSELFTYAIDPTTGVLSEVAGSRAAIGNAFGGMTLDRNGRFVYVFDLTAGTISAFGINATTGVPTPITGSPFTAGANIGLLSLHPNGKFIYARRGPQTQDTANGVAVFAIDESSGAISEIAGSPFDTSANPIVVTFDPTGRSLYAGHLLVQSSAEVNVRAYWVNSETGALSVIDGSPFASSAFPLSLDVDGSGQYLYAANVQSNQLSAYRIDSGDGALTQVSSGPTNVGFNPVVVTTEEGATPVSLSSKFVYATDPAGSIHSFNIAADGTLSSGAVLATGASSAPLGITLDPQGRYAYVADPAANAIRIYSVDAGGTLNAVASGPVTTGGDPQYVAVGPSGRYAYVSIPSTTTIVKYAIDAATGNLVSPVSKLVTGGVQDLAITPNGRWLMTTSTTGTAVRTYSIDPGTGELGNELSLDTGEPTRSLAVDASGKFAYVTSPGANAMQSELRQYRINTQTGALTPVGTFGYAGIGVPHGVAVDPKGMYVFTANSSGNNVSILSIESNGSLTYRGSSAAGTNPIAVTTDYNGDFVRVTTASGELLSFRLNRNARSLTLIDTEATGVATSEPATVVTSSHAE